MYVLVNDRIINEKDITDIFGKNLNSHTPIFFYKIFVSHSVVTLWNFHKKYFELVADYLNQPLPPYFIAYDDILRRLVNRNKLFTGALVKLIFFPCKDSFCFFGYPELSYKEKFSVDSQTIVVIDNKDIINAQYFNIFQIPTPHNYIYRDKQYLVTINNEILNTRDYNLLIFNDDKVVSPTYISKAKYNAFQLYILQNLEKYGYKLCDEPLSFSLVEQAETLWLVADNIIYTRTGFGNTRYYSNEYLAVSIVKGINKLYFDD